MSDGDMVECPADGCDYGPKPRKSVVAHYSGTRDGDHAGGYSKAQELVSGTSGTEPKESASGAREGDRDGSQTSTGDGSDPAKDTPPVDSDAVASNTVGPCPECGASGDGLTWFDASEYTSGEYSHGCADCSSKDKWVVWNE